jgi:predicted nucleotidyltransferase
MKTNDFDPNIESIIRHLKSKHKCHTALLYGSRARGTTTATSDFDILGISQNGPKTRITKKKNGVYWDVYVYAEKDLKKLNEQYIGLRDSKILFESKKYGKKLVGRIQKLLKKPFVPEPKYEIEASKEWAKKQLDRISVGDVHGLYRRVELMSATVGDYFKIRRKQFFGPKAGLLWIQKNDPRTFNLFNKSLKDPTNMNLLKQLVKRVYKN